MTKNYRSSTDVLYKEAETLYLLYVNEFLTVEKFAEWLELPIDAAYKIISIGSSFHNHVPEEPQQKGYVIY